MIIQNFLNRVSTIYAKGIATEHSYRSAIEELFHSFDDNITALNEPKRVKCGAPDFIVHRGEIAIGHIEAKDVGIDLTSFKGTNLDQKKRYLKGLPNLIYTNCLDFEFYRDGELLKRVSIADPIMGIQAKPENFEILEHLLREFIAQRPQTITSSKALAGIMAGKALLIKDVLTKALQEDVAQKTELMNQFKAFEEHLIHDITPEEFSDIYAETIAYGMFAARLHDDTLDDFSRLEALELLPKSNPFLRSLFGYIAGPDLDDRIKWIIDDLADVFQACDVKKLMASFGSLTQRNDPFLHFYEDFLKEYNPKKRKARGVWYTPEPVVNFIVRAVDDVLKTEFGLPLGLADTSKITVDWDTGQKAKTKKGEFKKSGKNVVERKEVHRVQILDPATGTGTFLAEVIKQIAPKIKGVAEGMWSSYIEKDLIPRIHGFELLMASYAMCHMKLDMVLTEMGYKPTKTPPRLGVYLTNSLEEGEAANQTLPFAQWLSNEVKQANTIKRDMPIMCIIGNPPYNIASQNKGKWIRNLIEQYKSGLNERKINLDDDYIKFIRLSEYLVEKNGKGVIGIITNNSFLTGVTHRKMREHLLNTFDSIHVMDLHGDSNKKETGPDGSKDENVFDIKQGVSITIFVKRDEASKSNIPAKIFHRDIFGLRAKKTKLLWSEKLIGTGWNSIQPTDPYFLFSPSDSCGLSTYERGFKTTELFQEYNTGIQTKRDALCLQPTFNNLTQIYDDIFELDTETFRAKYKLVDDNRDWSIEGAKADLRNNFPRAISILHRPFDEKKTFYTGRSKGFLGYPRNKTMQHMLFGDNLALLSGRQNKSGLINDFFVTKYVSEMKSAERTIQSYHFPLYLYPAADELDQTRRINFDPKILKKIHGFAIHSDKGTPDEVAVFDYIYGVLHSPDYRETYKEFLKMDFPRIPYPKTPDVFWHVSEKGGQLRRLHLMEDAAIGETPYPFKGDGEAVVEKPAFRQTDDRNGSVYINADQYFEDVPLIAWEFYIGGYQPAQKWLKDRKGRALSFEDILHYQKIIKILSETDRIMAEINLPLE